MNYNSNLVHINSSDTDPIVFWQRLHWTLLHVAFKMDVSTSIWHSWRQNPCKFSKCLLYANRFVFEENFQAAEDEESIPSDHNSNSESSRTSSEPASSHPRPWTSKTKVKKKPRSYISCVVAAITLNIVTCCLQDGWILLNMT